MQSEKEKGLLKPLTSLRFFAAFLVFLWHTHIFALYLNKFQLGYAGVGFFYLLSGFILMYVYHDKFLHRKKNTVRNFYIGRIAKIYPLHILTFLASIPLILHLYHLPKSTLLSLGAINLSLTQSYHLANTINFSFNGVAWSISTEVFFYLMFPLIAFVVIKYFKSITLKQSVVFCLSLWVVLFAFLLTQTSPLDDPRFYIFPPIRLPEFIIGALLGYMYLKFKKHEHPVFAIPVKKATQLEVASLALLAVGIIVSTVLPQSVRFGVWLIPFWMAIVTVFALGRGHLSSVLSHRWLVFLGEISFSFYMVHQLIIRYLTLAHLSHLQVTLISFAASLMLSGVLFVYFEEPVRKKLKKYLEARFSTKHRATSRGLELLDFGTDRLVKMRDQAADS